MDIRRNPAAYLDRVVAIAAAAASHILAIYEGEFTVTRKADGSPVTAADHAAHDVIVAHLTALTPELPVLSEESKEIPYATRRAWPAFWLVDPLDGTREFAKRNGEFTVNIALIEGARAVLGVVYVPVTRTAYYACAGERAYKRVGDAPPVPIHVRAYHGGPPTVVVSRSHPGVHLSDFLTRIQVRQGGYETRAMGSALKSCLVAEGVADIYARLGPTSEWDTAAAQCVVETAGGRVTDTANRPLVYNKPSLLNPWFLVSGAGGHDWSAYVEQPA